VQNTDDTTGEALEDVARIRPLVDRLRGLLSSAAFFDLKATSKGYWESAGEDERRLSSGTA
jgi:hypothetical protein